MKTLIMIGMIQAILVIQVDPAIPVNLANPTNRIDTEAEADSITEINPDIAKIRAILAVILVTPAIPANPVNTEEEAGITIEMISDISK